MTGGVNWRRLLGCRDGRPQGLALGRVVCHEQDGPACIIDMIRSSILHYIGKILSCHYNPITIIDNKHPSTNTNNCSFPWGGGGGGGGVW